MKKVLFLSPLPPPHYGAAISSQMCLEILKDSRKFEVKNIKLNYSKEMTDVGRINLAKIKGIFHVKKQIKKAIRNFKPDIIYFMPATSGLGLFRDYLFVKEIRKYWYGKILFHIRSRITQSDWEKPRYRKIYERMFGNERAIVLDKNLKKDLHSLIKEENLFVLPNAIMNEISDKELNKVEKARVGNNILFISNMDKSKGWLKLLIACKILSRENQNFHCNFVGAWPNKKEELDFKGFVKKNKLDKVVTYLGKKTGKDKNKFFEISNILIFPTEYKLETFGRVVIEGMMYGLPVIANGVAAIPTTIQDQKTGFILRKNTPNEIAEKVKILFNDNVKLKEMGKAGRRRFLKHYTLKRYRDSFLGVINNEKN